MTDSPLVESLRFMGYQDVFIDELLSWPDDEVLDEILRSRPKMSLRDRRILEEQLVEHRSQPSSGGPAEMPTTEQVLAKQKRLRAAKQHSGQKALAKALNVSQSTIRRRLGRL